MIEQNVQIIRCENQTVWVRVGSQTGCSACDNGQGCGAGVFAKLLQRKPVVLELPCQSEDLKAGQMATLSFPEQLYLKLVLANYGWPLLAALAGGWTGFVLMNKFVPDGWLLDAVTLFSGLLVAGLTMRLIRKRGATEQVLNEMKMAVCTPSVSPEMCKKMPQDT